MSFGAHVVAILSYKSCKQIAKVADGDCKSPEIRSATELCLEIEIWTTEFSGRGVERK